MTMKNTYAKIDGSNFQMRFQVFTSKTKKGTYIATTAKFETKEKALEYCVKNNYKVIK